MSLLLISSAPQVIPFVSQFIRMLSSANVPLVKRTTLRWICYFVDRRIPKQYFVRKAKLFADFVYCLLLLLWGRLFAARSHCLYCIVDRGDERAKSGAERRKKGSGWARSLTSMYRVMIATDGGQWSKDWEGALMMNDWLIFAWPENRHVLLILKFETFWMKEINIFATH